MVDSGATLTCVTPQLARSLRLQKQDKVINMTFGNMHSDKLDSYRIALTLSPDMHFDNIEVAEMQLKNCDMLLGMDILNQGDVCITHRQGFTMFLFDIPE